MKILQTTKQLASGAMQYTVFAFTGECVVVIFVLDKYICYLRPKHGESSLVFNIRHALIRAAGGDRLPDR